MNNTIKELSQEAHEIINNIKQAAENGEITWAQRNELITQVYTDVNQKLELAKNLLYAWTGSYYSETVAG